MNLQALASIAEDGPWCGTRGPGRPRPHPEQWLQVFDLRAGPGVEKLAGPVPDPWRSDAGAQPDPWRLAAIQVGLYGAIRLRQLGQQVHGEAAEQLTSASERLFDDWCGTVPLSVLIRWLLHWPPPPSPPWLDRLTFVAEMLAFAEASEQQQLASAASRQLAAGLKEFRAQV